MPYQKPNYHVLGTDHSPTELAQAIIDGPLVAMRDNDLRTAYPTLAPTLEDLKHMLWHTTLGDWNALRELKVNGFTYQSRVLVCIRQILSMFEDTEYDDDKFARRVPHYGQVSIATSPQQIAQALYDGPIVAVTLYNHWGFNQLEALKLHIEKVGDSQWTRMESLNPKDKKASHSSIIARRMQQIIDTSKSIPYDDVKLALAPLIKAADDAIRDARGAIRETTHFSLSHRKQTIYRVECSQRSGGSYAI